MELAAKANDASTPRAMLSLYLQCSAKHVGLPEVPREENIAQKMRRKGWYQLVDAINIFIKEGYMDPYKDWFL